MDIDLRGIRIAMVEPVETERDVGADSIGVNTGEVKPGLEQWPSIKDMQHEMRAAHVWAEGREC